MTISDQQAAERIAGLEQEVQDLRTRLLELSTVYQVSKALSLGVLTENLLDITGAVFADVFGAEGFLLLLLDAGRTQLEPVAIFRRDGGDALPAALPAGHACFADVLAGAGNVLLGEDAWRDWWPDAPESFRRPLLAIALQSPEARPLGLLVVSQAEDANGWGGASLLETYSQVADHLAVALEHARAIADARALSGIDPLTGLHNRRAFEDRLQREWHRAERYGRSLSLAMIDMDRFKTVNDTHGHDVGDDLLRALGRLFEQSVRQSDLVARFGGDEFVLLLPETAKPDAQRAVEKLLERLRDDEPLAAIADGMDLGFSGGIATFPEDAAAPRDLFRRADRALYAAKGLGGCRVLASPARPGDAD